MGNGTTRDRAVISLNGERRVVEAGSVQALLEELGFAGERRGVAVALNGRVVARSSWATQGIDEGDQVEIVGAVQGG